MNKDLAIVAKREFLDAIRSRWLFLFSGVFLILSLGIAYFGPGGMQDFGRTTASLLQLVLFLVPLFALVSGSLSLAGSRESLSLFLAQPLTRREVFLGKYLGLAFAITLGLLIGLGAAGIVLAFYAGAEGLGPFATLALLSLFLAWSFLSISFFSSVLFLEKNRAIGFALFLWFDFVVFYDLVLIGLITGFEGIPYKPVLLTMLFLNPVDLVRTLVLLAVGLSALLGPTGAVITKAFGTLWGGTTIGLSLLFWLLIPLVVAGILFERKDL